MQKRQQRIEQDIDIGEFHGLGQELFFVCCHSLQLGRCFTHGGTHVLSFNGDRWLTRPGEEANPDVRVTVSPEGWATFKRLTIMPVFMWGNHLVDLGLLSIFFHRKCQILCYPEFGITVDLTFTFHQELNGARRQCPAFLAYKEFGDLTRSGQQIILLPTVEHIIF